MKSDIFILEDCPLRVQSFMSWYPMSKIIVTNNADDALMILKNRKFGLLFLDHDLGTLEHHNTGAMVARNLHETLNANSQIIIHSHNSCGAKTMFDDIKKTCPDAKVIRMPFNVGMKSLI